jgi:hypothetical protein
MTILGTRAVPTSAPVAVGLLNDAQRVNIPTTGEQWENAFVEFQNVTVTEVISFGGNRISFNVVDAAGNKINVSDRFLAQKLPSYQTVNPASPQVTGSFVPPVPGTFYSSLKGVLRHDGNGCFTGGGTRGYELNPFDASHYQIAYAPPYISQFERDPMVPTPNQSPDLICTITDFDGTVDSVHVFYTTNATLQPTQFTKATMALVAGSTDEYEFSLPSAPDGTLVRYYIKAKDDDGNVSYYPTTPVGQAQPNFDYYTVRAGGMKIYDIQYSLASNGNSPFLGQNVTVKGIVTASTKPYDLGYLYIQDANGGPWSGIWCAGSGITQFFREEEVLRQFEALLPGNPADGPRVDLVLSDMAPNLSGVSTADSARMGHLADLALEFSQAHLKPNGALLIKCFHGSGYSQIVESFKKVFKIVTPRKPKASRDKSAETFLLGKHLK